MTNAKTPRKLLVGDLLVIGDAEFAYKIATALGFNNDQRVDDLQDVVPHALPVWDEVAILVGKGAKFIFLSGDHSDAAYLLTRIRITFPDGIGILWYQQQQDQCRITDAELGRLRAVRMHPDMDPTDIVLTANTLGCELP